jgi:hypothetical protein
MPSKTFAVSAGLLDITGLKPSGVNPAQQSLFGPDSAERYRLQALWHNQAHCEWALRCVQYRMVGAVSWLES